MLKSCAFTGHRPQSFPWRYDETAPDCVALKAALAERIEALVEHGVTDFWTGLAQGVDIWAAQTVLAIRAQTHGVKLHCILPCKDQAAKWEPSAQELHQQIQEKADSVICLSEEYYDGCMLDRNRYLVDRAEILLAVYNGGWRGGTAMTLRYAKKLGREIIVINPKTRKITCF